MPGSDRLLACYRVVNIGADRETTLKVAKELLPNLDDVSL